MFDTAEVRRGLATWVADLEPGVFTGDDARRLLDVMSDVKRLAAAAESLLAARVAECDAWHDDGADRSAAHWLARRTGISIADAKAKLDTVRRLDELPATAEAFRAGRLSEQQARAVVDGALADPAAEQELLDTAAGDSLKELRDVSRRAQAVDDEEGRQKRAHERRALRMRVEPDGTFHLTFRGTLLAGARIKAALHPFATKAFTAARREGRIEGSDAYAADGLLAMAEAAVAGTEGAKRTASNVKVLITVDVEALRRGTVEPGETCEIAGVGPVSVATATSLLGEAALAIVIKKGVDVLNVTHLARGTTAHQQTALEFWGVRCAVKGCDCRDFVDRHHVFEYARSGHTRLDELRVYCRYHHREEHKGRPPRADQLRRRGRRPRKAAPVAEPDIEAVLPLSA
jgi:hypothetical protein